MRERNDTVADARPKVLVISDTLPGYQIGLERNGAAAYLRAFIERFQHRGYEVVWNLSRPRLAAIALRRDQLAYRLVGREVASLGPHYVVTSAAGAAASIAYQVYRNRSAAVRRRVAAFRATFRRARGCQSVTGRYLSVADTSYVRRVVARERPQVILFDSIFNVCLGIAHPSQWIITHDVRHQRHAAMRELGLNPAPHAFSREDERTLIEAVGNAIAIQWEEAQEFRRLAPGARVVVVPMPVTPEAPNGAVRRIDGRCLFVGSASYPNVDALRWFLTDCWPTIRCEVPGAELDVCGAVCDRFEDRFQGVRLLGVVEDLGAAYRRAGAVVVPLRAGSGLKVKLVEAMAHGAACVTTPVGAQGLSHLDPPPFAVADDAQRFARETIRILADPSWRTELSERAEDAARHFRPNEAFAELEEALSKDAARVGRGRDATPPRVCVAIPTYRRPALLAALLEGLASQSAAAGDFDVAVFDNDSERSAEAFTNAHSARSGRSVHYLCVPEPGLSSVRNAVLEFARGRFDYLAMIDDDEVPEPQWLEQLLMVRDELDADAVVGPVPPILPESAPSWIARGKFFEMPPQGDRMLIGEGYTGNCLLKLATIASCRLTFDADCNLAGGEDQLFFRQLVKRGGRIAYAASAVAWERVLPERLSAAYLLRRHLRRGNSLWICEAKLDGRRRTLAIRVARGLVRVAAGSISLVPRTVTAGRAGFVGSLCDVARGVGMLAGFLGVIVLAYERKRCAGCDYAFD